MHYHHRGSRGTNCKLIVVSEINRTKGTQDVSAGLVGFDLLGSGLSRS